MLIDEVNLESVLTATFRHGVFNPQFHCFTWSDGPRQRRFAMEFAYEYPRVIKDTDGRHYDAITIALSCKPQRVAGVLNCEQSRKRLSWTKTLGDGCK